MAEIVWTDEAKLWLREIFEYIASEHPDTAVRVVDGILARAESLRTFPEMGPTLELEGFDGLRGIRFDPYRIVYRIQTSERIEIIGVFHDSLDLVRHVGPRRGSDSINE